MNTSRKAIPRSPSKPRIRPACFASNSSPEAAGEGATTVLAIFLIECDDAAGRLSLTPLLSEISTTISSKQIAQRTRNGAAAALLTILATRSAITRRGWPELAKCSYSRQRSRVSSLPMKKALKKIAHAVGLRRHHVAAARMYGERHLLATAKSARPSPSGPQAVFCAIIRLVNVPAALTMSTPSGFADKLNWPCMQDFVWFPLSRLQQRGVARWILQLLSMMDGQAFCPTQHLSFVTTTYPGYSLW